MFSGIVEHQAPLVDLKNLTECNQITLEFDEKRLENLVEGASIAVNGVCLTVVKIAGGMVFFDVIKESLNKTNLSDLKIGDLVNIERALKFGDEIGGHLLSGHIIKTAPFLSYGLVYLFLDGFRGDIIFFVIGNLYFSSSICLCNCLLHRFCDRICIHNYRTFGVA